MKSERPVAASAPRNYAPHLVVGMLAIIAINLLWYANEVPFFHEESRRALVAQEMLLTGDYVVPTSYQQPYYKKPPLQNWLIALASSRGGVVSGLSARIVSVLALLATALAVLAFLRRRQPAIALTAFAITAGNFLMLVEYGNKVEPDILVTAMTTLAFLSYLAGPTRFITVLVSACFMGAGVLTKGLSPLYFYPPVLFYLVVRSQERGRQSAWLALHAILSLLLPALWLWQYHLHGDLGALLASFSSEVSSRHERGVVDAFGHLLYFPLKAALVLAPWSLVLWYARKPAENRDTAYWCCRYGFLFALILFTLLPGGRSRYLMPAVPLFAIAAAWHIDATKPTGDRLRLFVSLALGLAMVGLGVRMFLAGATLSGALLVGGAVASVWLFRRKLNVLQAGVAASLLLMFAYIHGLYAYRTIDQFDYAATAEEFCAQMTEDLPVVVDDEQNPKWIAFYLEAALKRPVYGTKVAAFPRYYFVTVPAGGHHRTGWAMTIVDGTRSQ